MPQLLEVLSLIDSALTILHTFNSPPPHILDIDLLLMPFLEVKFMYKIQRLDKDSL